MANKQDEMHQNSITTAKKCMLKRHDCTIII